MDESKPDPKRTARRWLRTLRAIRRRVQDTVPPPSRFLLIVTPLDSSLGSPLHVEAGGERDGEHWALVDRGGDVVRRLGVPCLVTVHDLDEADPDLATVACLWLDADGSVMTRPPGADEPEGRIGMHDARSSADAAKGPDDGADDAPVIRAGDPCPACGGGIVIDATVRYTRVPVHADGTPTDEGEGGDVEWDGPAYCGDCGLRVQVEP